MFHFLTPGCEKCSLLLHDHTQETWFPKPFPEPRLRVKGAFLKIVFIERVRLWNVSGSSESGTASALQGHIARGRRHAELIQHIMPRAITWAYRVHPETNTKRKGGSPRWQLGKDGQGRRHRAGRAESRFWFKQERNWNNPQHFKKQQIFKWVSCGFDATWGTRMTHIRWWETVFDRGKCVPQLLTLPFGD